MAKPYEAPDQEFVNMLWKWFEDRDVDLRAERSTGLTADDFCIMLDEHEQALTDEIEKLKMKLVEIADPTLSAEERRDVARETLGWVVNG